MTNTQKIAIGYAIRAKANERRKAFIIEKEGSLRSFELSKYKTLNWYIKARYGISIA